MEGFDARFQIPSNMMIVGPTSSGKTTWIKNLLQHKKEYFNVEPEAMILFYKENQKIYDEMQNIMIDGKKNSAEREFPVFKKVSDSPKSADEVKEVFLEFPRRIPKIVVFDDQLDEIGPAVKHLFTVLTHHYNCFTIFLSQTLFDKSKDLRTLSINTQYMVLFNNPRDRMSVSQLAKQVFPGKIDLLNQAYEKATKNRAYGYLLLDFHQRQDDRIRIRSHIFPKEFPTVVYLPWDVL